LIDAWAACDRNIKFSSLLLVSCLLEQQSQAKLSGLQKENAIKKYIAAKEREREREREREIKRGRQTINTNKDCPACLLLGMSGIGADLLTCMCKTVCLKNKIISLFAVRMALAWWHPHHYHHPAVSPSYHDFE
jgi:hypothetical protein